MAQIIMDRDVPGCFGTNLAPHRGVLDLGKAQLYVSGLPWEDSMSKNAEYYYDLKPRQGQTINSWNELLEFYQKSEAGPWKRRWIFGGEKDCSWRLETTLERAIHRQCELPLGKEAERWEYRLLRQFERIAPMFLSQPPGKDSWIEWLALLRHYGGPARLLDWTYSFLIAAFHAIEKSKDGHDSAICAIDVDWWKEETKKRIPELAKIREEKDPHSEAEYDLIRRLKGKKGIWPVNAFRLNERLQAQQGVFLMPLDVSHSFMDNLRALATPADARSHLWKIVISSSRPLRKQCLTELQRMNIQNQTLFRGLDGLAKDLENQMLMPELFQDIEPKF